MSNLEHGNFINDPGQKISHPDMVVWSDEAVLKVRNEELSSLFADNWSNLLGFIERRVHISHAEDIASEVFSQACQSWGNYSDLNKTRRHWLFGIAKNVLRSHYRNKYNPSAQTVTSLDSSLIEPKHREIGYAVVEIKDLLDRLPENYREAIELNYLGYSGEEAGMMTGKSHVAFRADLLRARKAAKKSTDEGLKVNM